MQTHVSRSALHAIHSLRLHVGSTMVMLRHDSGRACIGKKNRCALALGLVLANFRTAWRKRPVSMQADSRIPQRTA